MIDFGFNVSLHRIQKEQLPKLLDWRNDRRIWKWCRQNDLISWESHERWFERQELDPSIEMYGIEVGSTLVGVCGLTSIDQLNRRAEFSLYIGPEYHGRGYGSGALRTLFTHGFMNLGLNSIWGESFDGNPAIKMFESIGMKKDGTLRECYFRDGHFIDAHLYGVLRSNWDSKLPPGKEHWDTPTDFGIKEP